MTQFKYTLLCVGEAPVAGVMQFPPQPAPSQGGPGWLGYVYVEDVDGKVMEATGLGAKVLHAPSDIPDVGRFSVLADPQGAVFALFKPNGAARPPAPMTPEKSAGTSCMPQTREAFAFYGALLGWQRNQGLDMGPLGIYQIFGDESAPMGFGGMFNDPEGPPHWLFYFAVADIDAATARVTAGGGTILHGPRECQGAPGSFRGAIRKVQFLRLSGCGRLIGLVAAAADAIVAASNGGASGNE